LAVDISGAIQIDDVADFDRWLAENGRTARDVVVSIYKKSSGKQTVTLNDLQEVALCHGWVDNLGQRVDDERWALRFTPAQARVQLVGNQPRDGASLLADGRVLDTGKVLLPNDL
jgi:uncharacterized protein YdeI (YjbR/CyaY-like superfamily)